MLTKIQQIKVLEDARNRIVSGKNKTLREAIFNASRKLYGVKSCVDLLTFENAKIACRAKKVKMPNEQLPDWFEAGNKISRNAVINFLIEELKK